MQSTRKATLLAARRRRVAEAYLRGTPQYKIAEAEGVHNGQISRDLATIRDEWKTAASVAFGERVATELAKLDELERTYWDAWERSKQKTAQDIPGDDVMDSPSPGSPVGDPRFLVGVESCIDKRCKILGLYQQRVEHTGAVGMLVIEVEKDGRPVNDAGTTPVPSIPNSSTGGRGQAIPMLQNRSAA